MIKEIIKDEEILSKKCEPAMAEDASGGAGFGGHPAGQRRGGVPGGEPDWRDQVHRRVP